MNLLKDKRFTMTAIAVIFLAVIILLKIGILPDKESANEKISPLLGNETIQELVNQDTDLDGVSDWEEGLWGTDPNKKETTPGTPDGTAIVKLKSEQKSYDMGEGEEARPESENPTQTDKFSQEFFATVATLNQNGVMDQATIDKLSQSLAEHIQNSIPRKVYVKTEIKIIEDNSAKAVTEYNDALESIHKKYPSKGSAIEVMQKFIIDENNVDVSVLPKLDPIIIQTNNIISTLVKTNVPSSLSALHLEMINAMERLAENLSDIKLYEADVIVSLSAISQYDQNTTALENAINNLADAISKKLGS